MVKPDRRLNMVSIEPTKICRKCQIEKSVSEFYEHRKHKDGRQSYCKTCARPTRNIEREKQYYQDNKERLDKYQNEYNKQLRLDIFSAYGGCCQCCGETKVEFLCIDHIKGGGHKMRTFFGEPSGIKLYAKLRKLGYPKNDYRVLCHNCNQSNGSYGYCPHTRQ